MRQTCEECGDFTDCNEDGVCFNCLQERHDLEEWLPEDGYDEEEVEEDED